MKLIIKIHGGVIIKVEEYTKAKMRECRDTSLDLIRVFANFSVISVHFFLNNGFYSEIVMGKRMYLMVLLRTFFMICVPLFIVLTGYLMSSKKLTRKYYSGIIKTLFIYVLASVACIFYKNYSLPETYDLKKAILGILDFSAANYSWYIEMYIGLFLLIPFINLIYQGLNNKIQKQILILTLLLLTALPSVVNIFHFTEAEKWGIYISANMYQKIIPAWWTGVYPLCYYFIGCYMKEYGLKFGKVKSTVLLLGTVFFAGSMNYCISYGTVFQWGGWQSWGSLFNVISTVLVFNIFRKMKWINNLPNIIKIFIKWLSDLTLGAYLVSYVFDSLFYQVLLERVPDMIHRLEYYFIIVPAVFICSMLLSAGINVVYKLIGDAGKFMIKTISKSETKN